MPVTFLDIQSVSKLFDRTLALDEVSLQILEGEFVFLLGPSGCGKTTLLRIVAGLEDPTRGRVVLQGQDLTRLPPSKRGFGIVFQSYALFPNLTVFQNIAYGLENRRLPRPKIRERVAELLELVGLSELAARYPAQLSGGQQQRIALARALATSPGLLLLDEPLSALDARVRANLRIEVSRLQRRLGVTTIMVSHDQEEALTMADRVVVINEGRIVQEGTPEDVYHRPATPFVADVVGLMNLLTGVVSSDDGRQVRVGDKAIGLQNGLEVQSGQPVTVAIRPEKVQVVLNGQTSNVLDTLVHEVEFMGPFYRLHLQLGQDARLIAYMPPEDLSGAAIRPGAVIPVHLPAHHLRAFPAPNMGAG